MLEVHCENRTILDALTARHLAAGETGPAFHATSRPPYVEAEATGRAIALARAAGAPLYVVHLSSAEALGAGPGGARRRAARVRRDVPPLPRARPTIATRCRPRRRAKYVISPPLRAAGNPEALWDGLADGSLALVATDHVPDRVAVEKQSWRESFDRISNGGPGIETLLAMALRRRRGRRADHGRAPRRRARDDAGAAVRHAAKGAIEVGRDADLVLFDPAARRTVRAADLHHTSDYTPYEGREVSGRRPLDDRPRPVRRPRRRFVGSRGYGRFVERSLETTR